MKKALRPLAVCLLALLSLAASGCLAMRHEPAREEPSSILVRFRPHAAVKDIEALCRAHDLAIVRVVDPPFVYQLRKTNPVMTQELLRILRQDPLVLYAEEDHPRRPHPATPFLRQPH